MAMFLDRALDLPDATTDYFDDDDGKTGEGSINALAKARITGGCGPRRFCPTASVTRAQMAMFLDRALALPNATTDYFDDDDGKTGEVSINALAAVGHHRRLWRPPATARPEPSRASRWPPSCTAPTCRAASTETRGLPRCTPRAATGAVDALVTLR